jgi:DNA invertase Pin-like site-specific DNA recombinase
MIDRIEKGEASGILAWHPDRLARNSVDGGKVIYLVDTGMITDLKFPTFWFDSTPQGKFMLSIAFSQSKYYVDNLSENIKRGHRNKVKDGIWPQMAPIGYVNEKGKGIVPHPEFSGMIRKIFEQYATGNFTLRQVKEKFNELGLRGKAQNGLSVSNYQTILKNPIYTGLMRYNGEIYEGKHEPIISKKLFDDVQEVMTRKSKPKTKELKSYVYRGLLHCGECGCFITTETQKGHNYLRCTKRKGPCNQKYVREEIVTEQIRDELRKVSLSDAVANWLIAETEKDKTENNRLIADQSKKVTDEIAAIDSKLDKLMTAYLENALTLPEYQNVKNKLVTEKHSLNDKLASLAHASMSRFEPVVNFFQDCKQAAIVAKSDDLSKIRDFFQKVGSNPLLRDRALVTTARAPFALTHELPKNAKENADGTAGGVWGGMPCRPQLSDCISPFSGDPAFFAILRQYMNKVRTFFAENPESHE